MSDAKVGKTFFFTTKPSKCFLYLSFLFAQIEQIFAQIEQIFAQIEQIFACVGYFNTYSSNYNLCLKYWDILWFYLRMQRFASGCW